MKDTVEIEVAGETLRCEFEYSAGRPGVHTLRNGDPGYPDEPDELEVTKVDLQSWDSATRAIRWHNITDLVMELNSDLIEEKVWEVLPEPEEPEPPETDYDPYAGGSEPIDRSLD